MRERFFEPTRFFHVGGNFPRIRPFWNARCWIGHTAGCKRPKQSDGPKWTARFNEYPDACLGWHLGASWCNSKTRVKVQRQEGVFLKANKRIELARTTQRFQSSLSVDSSARVHFTKPASAALGRYHAPTRTADLRDAPRRLAREKAAKSTTDAHHSGFKREAARSHLQNQSKIKAKQSKIKQVLGGAEHHALGLLRFCVMTHAFHLDTVSV